MLKKSIKATADSSIQNQYGLKYSNSASYSTEQPKLSKNTSGKFQQQPTVKRHFHITLKKQLIPQSVKRSSSKSRRKSGISLSHSLTKKINLLYQSKDFGNHLSINDPQNQLKKIQTQVACYQRFYPLQSSMNDLSLVKQPKIELDQQTYYTGKRSSRMQISSTLSIQAKQNIPIVKQQSRLRRSSKTQLQRIYCLRKNNQESYLSMEEYFPSKIDCTGNKTTEIRQFLLPINQNTKKKAHAQQKSELNGRPDFGSLKSLSFIKQYFPKSPFKQREKELKSTLCRDSIQFSKNKERKRGKSKSKWQIISSLDHGPVFQSVNFGIQ